MNTLKLLFASSILLAACATSPKPTESKPENARYAAGDVFHALMSGDLDIPGHSIPSSPAGGSARCDELRRKVSEAFAAVDAGLFDIKSGGVRQVQGIDVSVAYFEGGGQDLAVLDDVKSLATSCYSAQPVFSGAAGDFIVTDKVDLGGGKWRYEVDPTTAKLNAATQGSGSVAAATFEDGTPTKVSQVSVNSCTSLPAGTRAGDPAVIQDTPSGATTSLFLLACRMPNLGKFKSVAP